MNRMKALESLMDRAAALPDEAQAEFVDAVADAIEHISSKHDGVYRLTDDERRGVERGLRDLREGRLASDEQVAAIFARARGAGT
jgi:hypothetical protein